MKKKKLTKSVTGKIILGLLLLGFVLSAAVSAFIGISVYRDRSETLAESTMCDELVIINNLDRDKLRQYIRTNETDDYYYAFLDDLKYQAEQRGFMYLYFFCLGEDGQSYYVFDSGEYGLTEGSALGSVLETDGLKSFDFEPLESIYYDYEFWISSTEYEGLAELTSISCPVYDYDGSLMAFCAVDFDTKALVRIVFSYILTTVAICVAIVAVSIFLFYISIKKRIAEPIEILKKEVKDTAKKLDGGETVDLGIKTGDEIEELSHVFENMYVAMKFYMEDVASAAAEKEHIASELSIAADIQASLLPRDFPERPEFRIYATMDPAKEIGGDFYDFFMVDDSHLAFVVADVSGKGIPAALFMVIAKTLIKDHTGKNDSLGDVFANVNNILLENDDRGMFVTAFEGVLNLKTGEVVYVNAGHEPPFVRTKDGYAKLKPVSGLVLSCMPDMQYKVGTLQLSEGDAIFQYTDGVTEATDANNELYGFDRIAAFLNNNTDKTASELLPLVKADIDAFVGDAPQFDDITMLCLEFTEKMKDK